MRRAVLAAGHLDRSVITLDGAHDDSFGRWPPAGLAEGGEVSTQERR